MAPMRVSNLERREWRTKCRDELSRHIQSRLGIVVEPAQVRLLPSPDNPYAWRFLPEKKHLFSKNISDHSINAYKELCDGVGKTFEAILAKQGNSVDSLGMLDGAVASSVGKTEISFSALIDRLQGENALLSHAMEEMRTQLSAELERRRHAERELEHLKEVNQRLQEESEENLAIAMRLKGVFDAQSQGLKSAVQELQALQEGLFMGT
ncbi:hypothetical protein BU23DRAFT_630329 [Bimuria novae-zelandiae CBS 107.79]|uniref:Uncharacterized protein n=1 Tax=Bimuria novae-zelandiae CBS 107.79 TaxID=1447943 RepID=A0A6A5UPJ5_9PLEO|nr:hypothetical protein BU23DRAFT_630329 [Bimuria novae-zelandiae CBS 107.79]